jgi:hypothetical protein
VVQKGRELLLSSGYNIFYRKQKFEGSAEVCFLLSARLHGVTLIIYCVKKARVDARGSGTELQAGMSGVCTREIFKKKVVEGIKTHILYSEIFSENRVVHEIMWKIMSRS